MEKTLAAYTIPYYPGFNPGVFVKIDGGHTNYMISRGIFSKSGASKMLGSGESQKEVIRPAFNRSTMIDFQGTKSHQTLVFSWCGR
jgi:hypothetical protein